MKKLASLALTAAMVLSLAGCGQQDTAASDNSSVIAPSEPEVTSTSATTTSATTTAATTTAATTTTTEATTTTAPVVEEDPVQADPTAITGDVTLSTATSFTRDMLWEAYGDTLIMYNEADSTYYLADINGKAINDTLYSSISKGFDADGYAVVDIDGATCVIDKQGNVAHENIIDYYEGITVTKDVSATYFSPVFFADTNMLKFTFTDTATGKVLCTLDEHEMFPEPDEYTPRFNYMKYKNDYALLYALFPVGSHGLMYLYSVDNQGNMTKLYEYEFGGDCKLREQFGKCNLKNVIKNNNILNLHVGIESDGGSYDSFSALYDMTSDKFYELDTIYEGPDFVDSEIGIYTLKKDDFWQVVNINDSGVTVLLDGLTTAIDSGSDKYLLISDGEKWGYYVIDSGEAVWYDDATNFRNGYAFVIEDGKGHFINEELEAVTDDIAATGATHYDGLLYLADTEQFYPVNYPAAE